MTTAVFKDGVFAADRLTTAGSTRFGEHCKIYQKNGITAVAAGNTGDCCKFFRWLEDMEKPLELKNCSAMFYKDGKLFHVDDETCTPYVLNADYFAIGSGMDFAYGALAMGASAKKAVEVACVFDTYSGGGVDVVKVK